LTLIIIKLLLYLNFRRMPETVIVTLSLPFALAGVAAQTGVVMLIYLDHALEARRTLATAAGRDLTLAYLHAAIMEGAVERVRPKMMTVVAIMAGLLPFCGAMAPARRSYSASPYR